LNVTIYQVSHPEQVSYLKADTPYSVRKGTNSGYSEVEDENLAEFEDEFASSTASPPQSPPPESAPHPVEAEIFEEPPVPTLAVAEEWRGDNVPPKKNRNLHAKFR
jgi:hypothetical protein